MSAERQRELLAEVLADDWSSVIRGVASHALPLIWGHVKNSTFGQRALGALRKYTGIDLNDDPLSAGFTKDLSLRRDVDWTSVSEGYARESQAYDGVSTQAVASILMPELTSVRIPSEVTTKTGKVSRSQTYTVTTNADGNSIWSLMPLCATTPTYITQANDKSLDIDSGLQSQNVTETPGPLFLYVNNPIIAYRVTATCVELQPLVSSLTNQGRVVCAMSDADDVYSSQAPIGVSGARDCDYVTYTSVSNISGHRLVFHDAELADEGLKPVVSSGVPITYNRDFMSIMVQGAAPNTQVLQVTVTYQFEFTFRNSLLVELGVPPSGAATQRCIAQALSLNPQLRILGAMESQNLYARLLAVVPRYQDVVELLGSYEYRHRHEAYSVGG